MICKSVKHLSGGFCFRFFSATDIIIVIWFWTTIGNYTDVGIIWLYTLLGDAIKLYVFSILNFKGILTTRQGNSEEVGK